ncbi:MAG TPA: ABC transporter substrate-binding protein [Nitrospira sp.]|nr:ABC transporter substrate-binding protein [Nitrospira sp.]
MSSHWSGFQEARISRRRALAVTGSGAVATALLAACGGGGKTGGTAGKTNSSGLVFQPVDTSKQAMRGGSLKTYWQADITGYDVHNTQSAGQGIPQLAYSRFVQVKPGYLTNTDLSVAGDMAESWEWSPDGLTLTMKLRQGAGWAPLPPVNGRPVDIDDIAYTWKRYASAGSNRPDYLNSLNPDAPVLSMAPTDARTFVWKLAFPATWLLNMMASGIKQSYIIPKESESQYDLRTTPLGSGPFYVSEYVTSSGWTLKRNPNFYDKEHPYIGEIQRPIVPEYATMLAQFKTGGIYDFSSGNDLRLDDVLRTKNDSPDTRLYSLPPGGGPGANRGAFFGWKPTPPEKTPFRDERVRQALSRSLDRDTWIDTFYNVPTLRASGLPIETRWNSALNTTFTGWWLDPKSKDFGPNAVNFQHNVAEAKKLLAAAGYPNGLDVQSAWVTTGYGVDFGKWVTSIEGMAQEAGFKFLTTNPDFSSEWPQKYRDNRGNFEGIAYRNWGLSATDSSAVLVLASEYTSTKGNLNFTGFDAAGKGDFSGDPTLESMIHGAQKEVDVEKQKSIVADIQRYLAKALYTVRYPGSASGFELTWPVIQNHRAYQGGQIPYYYEWIDEKQPPVKKA